MGRGQHRFEILKRVESGNVLYKKWHWARVKMYHDEWLLLLRAEHIPPSDPPAVRMRVAFHAWRPHLLDDDNLIMGLKPVRDCLKRLRYIRDDSPKWARFEYGQERGKPRLVVTVEPER